MMFHRIICLLLFTALLSSIKARSQELYPDIKTDQTSIEYLSDAKGNTILDFSFSGYALSNRAIADVPAKIKVSTVDGDATDKIQKAIDYVSRLKPDRNGFRGAVLLEKGIYRIKGSLYIAKSGVVLRGSGASDNGTLLLGTGTKRAAIIRILGSDDLKIEDTLQISQRHIPLGSTSITIGKGKLEKGDQLILRKNLTQDWLDTLQMNNFGGETNWIGWKTVDWTIDWDRSVVQINDNEIELDAPLTMELSPEKDHLELLRYSWPGRIQEVGVENLKISSTYHKDNLKDEQHRWLGISVENTKNAWIRQVNFEHLAGGAVHILKTASQVTVEDCLSLNPISEIASYRRHSFYTEGQKNLFQRCYAEYGYHDFAVGGYGTTGPNAFVQCHAYLPHSFSGTIGSWATGVLFDIVTIDGHGLSLRNQGQSNRGSGWTAANSVVWESAASMMEVSNPPTAQNWAFGVWGQFSGNAHWKEVNSHIRPRSLFYAQLKKRHHTLPVDPQILDIGSEPSSSPTVEVAMKLTEEAKEPLITLKEWILQSHTRNPIDFKSTNIPWIDDPIGPKTEKEIVQQPFIALKQGRLLFQNTLLSGKRTNVMWWRGSLRDRDINRATPHITRFVPGQRGIGRTDNLNEVVAYFKTQNIIGLSHNYGLWYDRRMDDHQRVRRIDADTWPPFYEQPFARSGTGVAWDHLSKYDLTKYNHWYWNRLYDFARLAEPEGQLLLHQQYFQHNILEAGAHWSSSPWRSINNINNTGFPEPPPYAGDKRIFMAEQFYDINHPQRKKLHQLYIEKSLENFKTQSNVIQFTSEEFTGPLHFMQFWIDVVKDWESVHENDAFIGLSATKDVQDAILNDSVREAVIDVIAIKYWYYKNDGTTYAPEGGKNLAPRQHARKMKTGKESNSSVYRAIKEYRERFPEKAVIYSTNNAARFGWAQLMAGASLPMIPKVDLESFSESLPRMNPGENEDYKSAIWSLQDPGESYLFFLNKSEDVKLDLTNFRGRFQVYTIDAETGKTHPKTRVRGGLEIVIKPLENDKILFIKKI